MTTTHQPRWAGPENGGHQLHGSFGTAAGTFPPASWWYVTWRARVLDESTGDVPGRLAEVANALDHLGETGGKPTARLIARAP